MVDNELAEYARNLILDHARDIEWMSIHEMAEEHLGREITDAEADTVHTVHTLCSHATITVDIPNALGIRETP